MLTEKDIRQKEFAYMIKRTPNTITRICNNEMQPSLKLLQQMAIILDVDITELLYNSKTK
ncbi:MAG: helix-turn-helix transcriptional regulator, partial [Cyclobacteriaceae bacterium]|nr:helix-turn-helix transcriptional regulator [Cyclobacteriaceae bacterium]